VRSDPLSLSALESYFMALLARGRIADVEKTLAKIATLDPARHRLLLIALRSHDGQWADGALAALEAKLADPGNQETVNEFAILLAVMGLDENALSLEQVDHHLFHELLGQPQVVVEQYEQWLSDQSLNSTTGEWRLGHMLAASGQFEKALSYLEDNWQYMDGLVAIPWFPASRVLALIDARRASGRETGSETLITALRDSVLRYNDAGIVLCNLADCVDFEAGIAAYLSGDRQSAAELLTSAVSRGYFIPLNSAYLQFLYDDPSMALVFERQQDHMLAQRQQFLRAICPDNPYADVWEPVEGTCDQQP